MISFDRAFHPEKKWKDIKLTESCPCKGCNTYKKYDFHQKMGSIAERQYVELPDSCKRCVKKLNWEVDCMRKLKWYENRDENLKE